MSLDEFGLIERIRRRTAVRADIVLGIGDDAALLQPAPGQQLVVTTDTLNVGVHFPAETPPADIGWKALAVNLSDLAAMGAQPAWCSLSLSLPEAAVLSLPLVAIRQTDTGAQVWRIAAQNRQAEAVAVTLGERIGDRIVVTGALNPGDEILVRGVNSITEGQTLGERTE